MEFHCEDLRQAGVVLTQTSSIEATLVNVSGKPITDWALRCEIEWLGSHVCGGGTASNLGRRTVFDVTVWNDQRLACPDYLLECDTAGFQEVSKL